MEVWKTPRTFLGFHVKVTGSIFFWENTIEFGVAKLLVVPTDFEDVKGFGKITASQLWELLGLR